MNDPSSPKKFTHRDYAAVVMLFLVALVLRLPFRSQYAYHWDSAEFSIAITDYNVALSQPHAPGYFLYVMLGRLVNSFVHDPHGSLIWISVVSGSGLVALLYVMGVLMSDRRVAWVAALLAMTSPQLWFHSCVALTYIVDALLVCLLVLCCWQALRYGCRWVDAAVIGLGLAVLGGVRPQTVPNLIPLIAYVFWNSHGPRLKKLIAASCICIAGMLAWSVPMIQMSGGWLAYREAFHRHAVFNSSAMLARGGMEAVTWNVFFAALYCWDGLFLGVVVLAGALIVRLRMNPERKAAWDIAHPEVLRVLALWVGPMILMQTLVSFTKQPGYVLGYLTGLLVLVALAMSELRSKVVIVIVTFLLCLANVAAFLVWPRTWSGVFYGTELTAQRIRDHDQEVARIVHAIRSELPPGETAICHAREYLPLGLRHLQLYLPEFEQYQLRPDAVMLAPADKPMM